MTKLIYIESVDSTNDFLIRNTYPPFTAVYTYNQLNGRGRSGRKWITMEHEKNIIMSVSIPPPSMDKIYGLQIAFGYAICDILRDYLDVYLKWPNDLVLIQESKTLKLGGLLMETKVSGGYIKSCIFGVGINVNSSRVTEKSTSIFEISAREIDIPLTCYKILERLELYYNDYINRNLDISKLWTSYSALLNKKLSFHRHGKIFTTLEKGITSTGSLIAENSTGEIIITNEEVGYDFIL